MIKITGKQVSFLNSKEFSTASKSADLPLNLSAAYWKYLLDYNPFDYLKKISIPMFFAQGERDYQVTLKDFNLWKNRIKNNKSVVFKSYPGLNHIFMYGTQKASPKDYEVKGKVDEAFLKDLKEFILK